MKVASCAVPRVDKEKSVELVIALCLCCVITDSVLRVINSTNKVIELYISQKLHTHHECVYHRPLFTQDTVNYVTVMT